MAGIVDRRPTRAELYHELGRARHLPNGDVQELLRAIAKDKSRVLELSKLDMRLISNEMQQVIGKFLVQSLRGQIPPALAQAVANAQVGPDVMHALTVRLANAYGNQTERALGQAATPDAARAQASSAVLPQQALRWTQFVQRVLQPPGAKLQERTGSAAPKAELAILAELLGERRDSVGAAGLRTPKLVQRSLEDRSPLQRTALLAGGVGDQLAQKLLRLGINDPMAFVQAGALPKNRAGLAESLQIDRGQLLALLMRSELLQIGPGKNGEQGVRPDLLKPLYRSGIAMLGTMTALRTLSPAQLAVVFQHLRLATSGLARAVRNEHAPTKADLQHWTKTAARLPSSILLADMDDDSEQPLSRGDAQELIAAWYLENRLWDALAQHRRVTHEEEKRQRDRREDDGQDEHHEGQGGKEGERDQQRDDSDRETFSSLQYDNQRSDKLMCFWVTDFNALPSGTSSERRMYVCVDPRARLFLNASKRRW